MAKPYKETVEICAVCGENWLKHQRLTYWKLQIDEDDEIPSESEVDELVDFTACIELLKLRNQGPAGPVGPQGVAGASA